MQRLDDARAERLFARALAILDDHAPGHGEPILWHLALRGHPWGTIELARRVLATGEMADGWSANGLNRRAWRTGLATAAYDLAMSCFNERDLSRFRRWLRRAGRAGDAEAGRSLRRFETRLPHGAAHGIRRGRPDLPRDGLWSQGRLNRRRAGLLGRLD